MDKIVTIIGARPQFIKAAPVSHAIASTHLLTEVIVHTGQHYDENMSDIFFQELEIPRPAYNLNVGSGSHAIQTGEILKRLEEVTIKEKPKMVLIYGDTNSTLAGALSAAKLSIPVAHIEAGLRSFNRTMPEEINRIIADHLSTLLFAPTQTAVKNLAHEGILQNVFKTGDVMYDVALWAIGKINNRKESVLPDKIKPKSFILSTIHRAENTDNKDRLINIFSALNKISKNTPIIMPLHPRTKKMLKQFGIDDVMPNLHIISPVGFLEMVNLEHQALLIITDSGGIQKEAYFHRVPCVTLRDETEWVETVESGWNILANVLNYEDIVRKVSLIMEKKDRNEIAEYGDGNTATSIVQSIEQYLAKIH